MRLRCYLGACLYKPENVIILPDVSYNGVKSYEEWGASYTNTEMGDKITPLTSLDAAAIDSVKPNADWYPVNPATGDLDTSRRAKKIGDLLEGGSTAYQCAQFEADRSNVLPNTGHFGTEIDSPAGGDRIYGNFVYQSTPTPQAMKMVV